MLTLLRVGRVAIAVLALSGAAWAGLSSRTALESSPAAFGSSRAAVEMLRIPEGGRLPRAVVDTGGTLHVVYVQGGTARANLFHVTRESGASGWSEPRQVNSRDLSVSGVGPIDGAQLALGLDDRLQVVWLESEPGRFFHTRSHAHGSGFEPQRDLSSGDEGTLEAGPAVAADRRGNVYVFWHAGAGEDARRGVYLAVSRDDGTTFEEPRRVSPAVEGACACCGLTAMRGPGGAIQVSYRGAGDNVRRGQRLLRSTDNGRTFSDRLVHPWELGACPVSTTSLFAGPDGLTAAWETAGQVHFADVDRLDAVRSPPGEARFRRKNPVVAVDARGDTLLAWGDGPGFSFGGSLHWQVFDAAGRPVGDAGGGPGTIIGGSTAAAVVQDGRFLLIY
jgi:hypothetical protein